MRQWDVEDKNWLCIKMDHFLISTSWRRWYKWANDNLIKCSFNFLSWLSHHSSRIQGCNNNEEKIFKTSIDDENRSNSIFLFPEIKSIWLMKWDYIIFSTIHVWMAVFIIACMYCRIKDWYHSNEIWSSAAPLTCNQCILSEQDISNTSTLTSFQL